ncbi:HicB family protein [Aureimonas sp. SA4125]|uniref:type II toxin-antitoxin system HicB family antitoxin n=1 Tax=Aureimonas sp. SA4125 TaxID=2826993 RepID=UPI001CC358CD|nr:type II toxin-antitoxin system HicB family antitoxin [Aureimonas sp. SA4125]BDA85646.1 HicB family protein [Aureimonas sp. SA4125]
MSVVVALVHGEPGTYGISFPDFPGASSLGETMAEVMERGREALASHIEAMVEETRSMPVLRTLDVLQADPAFAEDFGDAAAVALVDVDLPGRSVRLNISMDETLVDRIDRRARALGETRSGFLASAARERLAYKS